MRLEWHRYRYFPYERELAAQEVATLLGASEVRDVDGGLELGQVSHPERARELVYFSEFSSGTHATRTTQAELEATNGSSGRQATRYSVHGLHEYKGKFNPQVARALVNIHSPAASEGVRILDPFCGSGTTLVESTHAGCDATGLDINPFAVFLANAKLGALHLSPAVLEHEAEVVVRSLRCARGVKIGEIATPREKYLAHWFSADVLNLIERLRQEIGTVDQTVQPLLLAVASNLLRDYSMQDPTDLRIRRRKTALPDRPLADRFAADVAVLARKLNSAQEIIGTTPTQSKALLMDSRCAELGLKPEAKFDLAITSPPYATALPYIDTQRLSIIWLGLEDPSAITELDARLIGSRETSGRQRHDLAEQLLENVGQLPEQQWSYCLKLLEAVGVDDGFRRQAVPTLLYRYFVSMRDSFESVRKVMRDGATYALVVGGNHTTLGGVRFDIDTPAHLAALAASCGWHSRELHRLQAYQRYGYHSRNAVRTEALVVLEAK